MAKTNFPRTGGQQRIDSFYRFGVPTGNVFWVSSTATTSTATGPGYSPETAFLTVDQAIGACTADNNDVIMVLPGHTETLTAAASVALDVAGVSIVGLGVGRQRPKFNYTTAAAASLDVTAARCSISNCVFTMIGVDAVTAGINVTGADFVFDGNEVEFADATNQATLAILTAATASRMIIRNNYFHGSADAGTAACIRHVAGNDVQILNNIIMGNFTTTLGGIDNTAAVTNIQIHGNVIANGTASAAKCIALHASTTGIFSNNRLGVLTGTAPVAAAAGTNGGGNYYSAAAGVSAATLL